MADHDLPTGWYDAEDGSRRYWDGSSWLTPAAPTDAPHPAPIAVAAPSRQRSRRGRTIGIVVAVVALLVVGGGVAAATSIGAAQAQAAHVAAVKHAKAVAVRRAAAAKAAKDSEDAAERETRATLITSLEHSVKKTAKKDVTDGVLTGPILDVSCTPLGGGSTDDLTQKSATFQCFAANKKNDDGTENGYNFSATANWDTGEYTWRLGS